jgi:DNA-binding MarR family transcriptional regulator
MRSARATDEELVILVIRTAKALVDRLRADQPETSMTAVHGLAARYLLGRDDVTTVELARHLGITKQSASEVVALLEEAGIVARKPHPRDGRARVVYLTETGKARLDDRRRRWLAIEREWAALVGRDNLETVREALHAYVTGTAHS